MKILIYGINYLPELTGIGKYTGEMSEWLSAQGHDVSVVTAPPYYPAWKVQASYSTLSYKHELRNGVHVIRCPLWVPKHPTGTKRILHLCSFAVSSFPAILWEVFRRKPEIVFVVAPTLLCAPLALLVSKLGRAQSWIHIQDFEIDTAFELGILKRHWLRKLITAIESWILTRFDTVSTISLAMVSKLKEKSVNPSKIKLFPNWANIDQIYPDSLLGRKFKAELGIPESYRVALYSGNMGEKQGLDVLVNSARLLQDIPDLMFVLCGEGAAKEKLETMSHGLRNVRFLPLQPIENLNALLNLADIHLLPQRADAADLVMPSKLTGMLASGKAVIATAYPGTALADTVLQAGGTISEPEHPQELANRITQLLSDQLMLRRASTLARQYAEHYLDKEGILERVFPLT